MSMAVLKGTFNFKMKANLSQQFIQDVVNCFSANNNNNCNTSKVKCEQLLIRVKVEYLHRANKNDKKKLMCRQAIQLEISACSHNFVRNDSLNSATSKTLDV